MYRSTGDIVDTFQSYKDIAVSQMNKFGYSAENCYNDIDMLTVGMYGKGLVGRGGCDDAEYRQQFTLWCMYCAPLMLGCDIRNISAEAKALITNRALIAINQDEANRPPVWQNHPWNENLKCAFKHLANGGIRDSLLQLLRGRRQYSGYARAVRHREQQRKKARAARPYDRRG